MVIPGPIPESKKKGSSAFEHEHSSLRYNPCSTVVTRIVKRTDIHLDMGSFRLPFFSLLQIRVVTHTISHMVFSVIVSAGKGRRFGGKVPKQLVDLEGMPVWLRSARPFFELDAVKGVVVVVPKTRVASVRKMLRGLKLKKPIKAVAGGRERPDSVKEGLKAVRTLNRAMAKMKGSWRDPGDPVVLIHDGARPLVSPALIRRVIQATRKHGAAVPGLVPENTIKLVSDRGAVQQTFDRSRLRKIQTPQGFRLSIIQEAYRLVSRKHFIATDDATLVERIGFPVQVIAGDPKNLKITTPSEIKVAKVLLR